MPASIIIKDMFSSPHLIGNTPTAWSICSPMRMTPNMATATSPPIVDANSKVAAIAVKRERFIVSLSSRTYTEANKKDSRMKCLPQKLTKITARCFAALGEATESDELRS